jgi:hypothetical protein
VKQPEGSQRERVRCSSLVDWPVCPCLRLLSGRHCAHAIGRVERYTAIAHLRAFKRRSILSTRLAWKSTILASESRAPQTVASGPPFRLWPRGTLAKRGAPNPSGLAQSQQIGRFRFTIVRDGLCVAFFVRRLGA